MTKDQLRIGLTVQTTQAYSGVPEGTTGEIVRASNTWPDAGATSVAVRWNRHVGDTLTDWFGFDELHTLEIFKP